MKEGSRGAVHTALDLYHFFYAWKDSAHVIPEELTFRLLAAEALFDGDERRAQGVSDDYDWTQIAKAFINHYPARLIDVAIVMLEHLGTDGTIIARFHSPTMEILSLAVERHPLDLWPRIAEYLGPPIDSRAFAIREWLRDGTMTRIPAAAISTGSTRMRTRELGMPRPLFLRCFRVTGRGSLLGSCSFGMERGRTCDGISQRISQLNSGAVQSVVTTRGSCGGSFKARRAETNPNVLEWLDEYISQTEQGIEHARIEEEREF